MGTELAKENMIRQQIRTLGIPYGDLLSVIADTPREIFVPSNFREVAYSEVAIPLNHGQGELTPQTVAKVLQFLQPKRHEKGLVLGCGCGYLTALLAKLTKLVDVVDRYEDVLNHVRNVLKTIGVYNVKYHLSSQNSEEVLNDIVQQNTFDLIVVRELQKAEPTECLKYLAINGRMLYFLGKENYAKAILVQRNMNNSYQHISAFDVYTLVDEKTQNKVFCF